MVLLNRRSIHDRPSIINRRGRYGDWEIDTVIGKQGTGAMVTLLERKSSFYLVKKVSSKQADVVADATIEMLQPFKSLVANRKQGNILIYNLENKSVRAYQARYRNGKRSLVVNQVDVPQDAIDVLNELYLLQEAFERVEKSNW